MSAGLVILITLAVFAVILMAEATVAVALTAAGIVGLVLQVGFDRTGATLGSAAYQATNSYALVVIPMFVLMGALMANSGILGNVFDLAARLTRRIPGGLGISTVFSAAGFSAVTGSSAATVTTLGRLCVGEMTKHGYSRKLAASIVAASGTLGPLIPPSIVLVIYGVLTNESVGGLLLASIIPGILTTIAYALTVVWSTTRERRAADQQEELALVGASAGAVGSGSGTGSPAAAGSSDIELEEGVEATLETSTFGHDGPDPVERKRVWRWEEIESVGYIALIGIIVLGGIYGGYMTETEAGAVGALLALIVLLLRSGRTERGVFRSLTDALQEAATNTAMLMVLVIGGTVFTLFLVLTRVPQDLAAWIGGLGTDPYVILVILLLTYFVLGAFFDEMSILLLTIPLTYPIIIELGFDGIWYGIILVKMVGIGLLMPPLGLNVFLICGIVKGLKVEQVFRGIMPFVLADIVIVALMVFFPEIATWLPDRASS